MISGEVFDATSSAEPAGQTLSPIYIRNHNNLPHSSEHAGDLGGNVT